MQSVEEMYGHFGPDVVKEIKAQVMEHGGMVPLLKKLNLAIPSNLDSQHEMLRNFIFQYGVTFFLKTLRSNMGSDDIERMKVTKLVSQSHQMPDGSRNRRTTDDSPGRRAADQGYRRRASDRAGTPGAAAPPPQPEPAEPRLIMT